MKDDYIGVLCTLLNGECAEPSTLADAPSLLEAARIHRVHHLIAWRIVRHGGILESWFGAAAKDVLEEARSESLTEVAGNPELCRVLEHLSAVDGARPVLFKGAALAHSHYPEPWLRPRLDADILISPASVPASLDALERAGYQPQTATSGTLVVSQASLDRTDRFGITHSLDVHWQIAN